MGDKFPNLINIIGNYTTGTVNNKITSTKSFQLQVKLKRSLLSQKLKFGWIKGQLHLLSQTEHDPRGK